jgi:hypothetical protein
VLLLVHQHFVVHRFLRIRTLRVGHVIVHGDVVLSLRGLLVSIFTKGETIDWLLNLLVHR